MVGKLQWWKRKKPVSKMWVKHDQHCNVEQHITFTCFLIFCSAQSKLVTGKSKSEEVFFSCVEQNADFTQFTINSSNFRKTSLFLLACSSFLTLACWYWQNGFTFHISQLAFILIKAVLPIYCFFLNSTAR